MLCLTTQPTSVVKTLEVYDYRNKFNYSTSAPEYRFAQQFKYEPIFVIQVTSAIKAFCHMLVSQVIHPNYIIYFDCDDYFEISRDEWQAVKRGDKKVISQIQSPIRETVIPEIKQQNVRKTQYIPFYTDDVVLNYIMFCIHGEPYYTLCQFTNEEPYIIDTSVADNIGTVLYEKKYLPLRSNEEILDPTLFEQFQAEIEKVMRKE